MHSWIIFITLMNLVLSPPLVVPTQENSQVVKFSWCRLFTLTVISVLWHHASLHFHTDISDKLATCNYSAEAIWMVRVRLGSSCKITCCQNTEYIRNWILSVFRHKVVEVPDHLSNVCVNLHYQWPHIVTWGWMQIYFLKYCLFWMSVDVQSQEIQ